MSNTQTNNWFQTLSDKITSLAEEFGLSDTHTNRFKDFAVTLAKEQYKIGNKYGASWAFKRAREETGQTVTQRPAV
jgi:hypothetical protein